MLDLDVQSLTGQSTLPDIEAVCVDLDVLCRSSPTDGLKYLIAMRILGTGSQFKKFHSQSDESQLLSPLVKRMFSPINPLLLLTAISISVIRRDDFCTFLSKYAKGLEIPNFEDNLLQINFARDNDELQRILELEDEYRDALLKLGTKILIKHGRLIEGSGIPTMLDLYWACWLVVNPMFQNNPLPTRDSENSMFSGWRRGIAWGFEYNSAIHNAREHYEYRLNQTNEEINQLLSQKLALDTDRVQLKILASQQKSLTLLVERARRFYYWAPHEISAYSGQTAFAMELMKMYEEDSTKQETVSFMKQEHAKFFLPNEILEQLKLNHSEEENSNDDKNI